MTHWTNTMHVYSDVCRPFLLMHSQPVSWIADWTIPKLTRPCDPNCDWVARSGLGIPNGLGCFAHLKPEVLCKIVVVVKCIILLQKINRFF